MVQAIAKLISALLDLPGLWMRWRSHRKDVKIQKLEVAIAQKDATVKAEHLHETYVKTQEIQRQKINEDAKNKDLIDISEYFSNTH